MCREIIRDFDNLPRLDIKKPRVGIVGEILVKFHPAANNYLADLLESEGAEAVVPDLTDFLLYCFYNQNFKAEHLGKPSSTKLLSKAAIWFMERYRKFLKPDGLIHLKTDSNFMFTYTRYMVEENKLPVEFMTEDLYHSGLVDDILGIRTYYEQQWLDRGLNIKYMKFRLPQEKELHEPDVEIELDEYRSYNRSKRSGLKTSK